MKRSTKIRIVRQGASDAFLSNCAAVVSPGSLRQALRDAQDAGHAYLVIDGTLIPIDRVAADRPFYSGKHRSTG